MHNLSPFSRDEKFEELQVILEDLKKKGKLVDVQICPRCKSFRVRRMASDMLGHLAPSSQKFECPDCGWTGRLRLYATNRPLNKKQIAVVSAAQEHDDKEKNEYR